MYLVDVSNPQNLTVVGWDPYSWIDDIAFSPDGNYLFSSTYWQGVVGIDVSNPAHPWLAGNYLTLWEAVWVMVENDVLYIASGYYLDICQYASANHPDAFVAPTAEASSPDLAVTPNPFNPATTISLQLPEAARVNLSVFDVSGRLVATLVDGWRDAGIQEITFDGSQWPSGVYLARLTAGNYAGVQKLVLMK